jgi:alkylation response protein AidB-like acyl-CoA dehydrogenase
VNRDSQRDDVTVVDEAYSLQARGRAVARRRPTRWTAKVARDDADARISTIDGGTREIMKEIVGRGPGL